MFTVQHWSYILKPALVLAALVLWWFRRERFGARSLFLGCQLLFAFIIEVCGGYSAVHYIHNLWMYDFYIPVEFGLLSIYLHAQFETAWKARALVILVFAFAVSYVLEIGGALPDLFVSRSYMLGSMTLGLGFIMVLYEMANQIHVSLLHRPRFWAYLGMAVFFSCNIPVMGLWNLVIHQEPHSAVQLYVINHVLFLIRYGLIVVAASMGSQEP